MTVRFPYQEFRKGQKEIAEIVEETVRKKELLALMAPTGYGKTPAIIYGLLKSGAEKILYLVRTINEIDPVARELYRFGAEFTFVYSARRMCPLFGSGSNGETSVEDFWQACRIARLKGACPYYSELQRYNPSDIKPILVSLKDSPPRRIVNLLRGKLGICPFFALRSLVSDSQFIVATYPYGFRPEIFESLMDPYSYEDLVVVVDEAHTLFNAHSLLEHRIKLKDIEASIVEVKHYAPDAKIVVDLLQDLYKSLSRIGKDVKYTKVARLDKEPLRNIIEEIDVIIDTAEHVQEKKIEEAILSSAEISRAKTSIAKIVSWLATIARDDVFLFIEINDETQYVATPLDPSVVASPLLNRAKAVILSSGTLPPGDFVRELLGVRRQVVYLDAELTYGRFLPTGNIYTAVARDVTTRYRERSDHMYRRLAAYVSLISRNIPGIKLAVYPSYELMDKITGKLPADLPSYNETKKTSLQEVHEKITLYDDLLINAVANGKLVEGVEFVSPKGENLLSTVIIVGVPYPQPDAYTNTQLEILSQRLGSQRAKYYVYTFSTIVKVKQALGRATRSPTDKAVYFLLDRRYLKKEIRESLRIPVKRVFSSVAGLQQAVIEARRHLGF
ncbi:MAG: ATP-dependent DNA helicase [Desulfurococcales archaeon]|nr:ATP-dependent DNA helicase [Desulfurococcales archaeon]